MNQSFCLIKEEDAIVPKSKPKYWHMAILDCNNFKDESSFYLELKKLFKLPSYFGNNLDAVADCLTDLEWIKKSNIIIIIHNIDAIDPEDEIKNRIIKDFLLILKDTMNLWNVKGNEGFAPKKFYTFIYKTDRTEKLLKELNLEVKVHTQLPIQRIV